MKLSPGLVYDASTGKLSGVRLHRQRRKRGTRRLSPGALEALRRTVTLTGNAEAKRRLLEEQERIPVRKSAQRRELAEAKAFLQSLSNQRRAGAA